MELLYDTSWPDYCDWIDFLLEQLKDRVIGWVIENRESDSKIKWLSDWKIDGLIDVWGLLCLIYWLTLLVGLLKYVCLRQN